MSKSYPLTAKALESMRKTTSEEAGCSSERQAMPEDEPSRLLCPITHVMFRDPVFADSGNTYERSAIVKCWKQQGEIRDPLHNTLLKSATLRPNWDKRRDVEEFLQDWPEYVPEEWSSRAVPPPDEDSMKGLPSPGVRAVHRRSWRMLFRPRQLLLALAFCAVVLWYWPAWDTRTVALVPAGGGPSRNISVRHVAREMSMMSVQELLSTMEMHLDVDKVQSHGCLTLRKLAVHHENQVSIASMGGVRRTVEALQAHPNDVDVQANGCAAFWNLAIDVDNQALILSSGGLEVIGAALLAHPAAARVQRAGCGALWNLGTVPANAEKIASSSTLVELVLKALRAHARSPDVQSNACGVLWNLGGIAATKAKVESLGGVPLIEEAVRAHHKATDLRWYCCGALRELAQDSSKPELALSAEVQKLCSDAGGAVTDVEL